MDYKLFLRDILKNNDMKSLKQYNDITERLVRKDKKFNKYLLKNNMDIIKQYGGGIKVRVIAKGETSVYNVHPFVKGINNKEYKVKINETITPYGVTLNILDNLTNLRELKHPSGETKNEAKWEPHRPLFTGLLNNTPVIIKIFSEDSYHGQFMSKYESFKHEYHKLETMSKLNITPHLYGFFETTFGNFKEKLDTSYTLPLPHKFTGREIYKRVNEIPESTQISLYIMQKCEDVDWEKDIINNLKQIFQIMQILSINNIIHADIHDENFVLCNEKIKIIDPLSELSNIQYPNIKGLKDRLLKTKIKFPITIKDKVYNSIEEVYTYLGLTSNYNKNINYDNIINKLG